MTKKLCISALPMVTMMAFSSVAAAADELPILDTSGAHLDDPPPPPDATAGAASAQEAQASAGQMRYGASGSKWWTVGGGAGTEFDGVDANVFGSFNYFIVDDVEIDAELGGWYFVQDGTDAAGINPAINFRWHFVNTGDWTVFADIGIGVLFATDDVPEGGTSFDFTPRAGMGFTRALDDHGTRLLVGARWQHFSNARIFGDDDNPGRDDIMLYLGVVFPF
ncbi:MAG: acyloxyacyl hydrolase [Planctomycetes bacterium]|nr:acyloxyacyl hydrolase [Planctomycetota bacterium]